MSKKLFIPGPIDVSEDVLEKMATPVISHRSKEASELQKSITEKAKKLFYTDNEILLSTSSGTGLMEGSIRCCTTKRAAVFSCGSFGDRWHKMGITNGVPTDLFKVELGQAIEPEMVDKVLATGKYDLITVTHNETSTGIRNPIEDIGQILKKYDDVVYCVDTWNLRISRMKRLSLMRFSRIFIITSWLMLSKNPLAGCARFPSPQNYPSQHLPSDEKDHYRYAGR